MAIGKYLTNFGVIGAVLGVLGTLKQTREMPNDWRRYVVWIVWVAGLVLAIGSVSKQVDDEIYEAEFEAAQREEKQREKEQKKAQKKRR